MPLATAIAGGSSSGERLVAVAAEPHRHQGLGWTGPAMLTLLLFSLKRQS